MNDLEKSYFKMIETEKQLKLYMSVISKLDEELKIFSDHFTKEFRRFGIGLKDEPFEIFYEDEMIIILFKGHKPNFDTSYIFKPLCNHMAFNIRFNKQTTEFMDIDPICFCIERALNKL